MPQDVMWRILHFLRKDKVPGLGAGGWAGRKQKRPMEPSVPKEGIGQKASASEGKERGSYDGPI
jgi:hypothetical protein